MAHADTHMGQTAGLHNRAHVGEVQVDQRRHRNQVGYACNTLTQYVVGDAERVQHRGSLADHGQQLVVRHDNQRIDAGLELGNALLGVEHTALAFKAKRLGHNADGQYAHRARQTRDYGSRAGAGAAAHAAGYEQKIRALNNLLNFLLAFLGGLFADFGLGTRAQAFGKLFADLYLGFGVAAHQRLLVGIYRDKLYAAQSGIYHAVDRVVTRAAYAYDYN